MTIEILKTIVETLGVLEIFDCLTGVNSVLTLNGHGGKLGLPFLKYITNPAHIWFTVISVPYGTTFWYVGDIVEHNGAMQIICE